MSSLDATATAINRTHSPDLIPGYRLEKLVGTGGMGEVHKATQLSLGRTVAIKLLSAQLAQDASFVARFQKEAAALATLYHPHIVSILDKGNTQTTYYLVMEYVDGPSLRERMRAPNQDPLQSLQMMLQICRAIDYAHHRGVIHRDLKPENILFDEQAGGVPKVTDFGLASFLDDTSSRFALTSTHVAMGTLSYMAPEQRVDAKTADGRADIFALGLILYELLVGELCTNVIRHADTAHERFRVVLEYHADKVDLVVQDTGEGFSFKDVPEAGTERPDTIGGGERIGGYGMSLVHALADRLEFHRTDPQGTTVRAEVALHYQSPEAAKKAEAMERGDAEIELETD